MNTKNKTGTPHLPYIDGLKGLACLAIMLHHILITFFPALYSGNPDQTWVYPTLELKAAQSPLAFWLNGDFMMYLFLFVSGFVIGWQVLHMSDKKMLPRMLVKRYLKLMLPLLIFCIWCVIAWKIKLPSDAVYANPPEIKQAILSGLYRILLFGDTTFAGPFWMFGYLFVGSTFGMFLAALCWYIGQYGIAVGCFVILAALYKLDIHYATVFCGTVSAMVFFYLERFAVKGTPGQVIGILMLAAGCFLGGFPTGVSSLTGIYRYFEFGIRNIKPYDVAHLTGTVLTFVGLSMLPSVQRFLSRKVFLVLSGWSYIIYIIHQNLIQIFPPILALLWKNPAGSPGSWLAYAAITGALVITISCLIAKAYQTWIQPYYQKFLKRILN